ncbi:jasmonate O-methyltransferase-like [Olea europaea var. sylvestris]|uniref:Jasmonate O-methyltransferase-like n=1 Tax=Olea europaea subsp. europaea TaxID=158383 RepID=A0A8S0R862_OLEEU|nr:jasmonate O-methyltransferase-like [Olea europaea var. sylvestris]CAA2975347.1 jasmonate O-methyltransferase-like [Olea europaea subsp. europaea]
MEVVQVLHMNKGEGETSYAKNSVVQKKIISVATSIIKEEVQKCLEKNYPDSMGIADLGCSSGPNSLMVISDLIDTIYATSNQKEIPLPELRVSLNDLPGNDFNNIFISLPEFYNQLKMEKNIGPEGCFISGVPGSFYGRLFPKKSLHFVHSSSSLHWLSQVPRVLYANILKPLNKGKIYISNSSPRSVLDAYLSQFKRDFSLFMKSRSEEMVVDGHMVLSFMGRLSSDPSSEESCMQWELLAQALMSMALEGLIEEEKIDSFNAPYYAPSIQEVRSVVEEEGSFTINCLEAFEIEWDGDAPSNNNFQKYTDKIGKNNFSRGLQVAKTIRAVVESMLEVHFGREIMDELFKRYAELVGDYFSRTRAKYIDLVISLTKKG